MAQDPALDNDRRNESAGELVKQLTQDMRTLVAQEIQLAKAELAQKGKKAGVGAGLLGGGGVVGFLALAALTAAIIGLLDTAMKFWLAALIVAVALFAVAGVLALVGKKDVQKGSPPVPTEAISSIKTDIATVKESARR